jgi:hypothetical protein
MVRRRYTFLQALDRRCPSAVGKSSILDSGEPPPCSIDSDAMVNRKRTLSFNTRPDPTAPQNLARGHHTPQVQRSASVGRTNDLQRSSTEVHRERGRSPPQKATPTSPPPPQRCRLATYSSLHYVHGEIWGSPTLPPPKRSAEGEGTGESPPARWSEQGISEIASLLQLRGRGDIQGCLNDPRSTKFNKKHIPHVEMYRILLASKQCNT